MDENIRDKKRDIERWKHEVKRQRKKKRFKSSRLKQGPVSAVVYRSKILDIFGIKFIRHKDRKSEGPRHFKLPTVFSLTANPGKTLEVIESMVRYSRTARRPRLVLDHRYITDLGLGAEAFLAVVLKEISLEGQSAPGSYVRGYKAQNQNARKIMDEIGCVRVLRTGVDEDIKISLRPTAQVFRHQNRGTELKVDPLSADPISITTREFSHHLDECLHLIGKKLSVRGRQRLVSYVAEVLINAQEHSGTAQWTIVGYVDQEDLMYRAAIFSLGESFAGTFDGLAVDSYALSCVMPYVERHEQAGFFGPHWHKHDLLTVIALQGNISCRLEPEGPNSDRGQGTVDLIEFFQDVSGECVGSGKKPRMSILSGGTHIMFDGSHRMRYEAEAQRMVIAFNKENNLMFPPEKNCVTSLERVKFPGVMISIAVPLAQGTVEEIPSSETNED